jgi:choice-of-anchor A domain-containing protein
MFDPRLFRVLDNQRRAFQGNLILIAVIAVFVISAGPANANPIPLGVASSYAALYEGIGGHNLQITNVTINSNVGVGGTGVVQFNGPGAINGKLNFAAANTGQYKNNNGSNVGPTSVTYGVSAVTTALNTVNSLSSSLSGLGSNLAISGAMTINESAGQRDTVNGVTYRVFKVTSYSENDGKVLTLNGDGSGDPVVFDFGFNQNVNLGGDVALTGGLTDDQVLWNFTSTNQNVQLNNNASSYRNEAFQGVILAPNDKLQLTNANLDGRVFGGHNQDMQIVSGTTITTPASPVPEPSTLAMFALGVGGLGFAVRRRQRQASI